MTGITQGTARVEDTPNNSEASGGPSSTPDGKKEQGEQGDFDDDDQCKIPMTVFWSSIQEENAAPKTDEKECDNDCETFHPTDAMSFAWQIARGMVGFLDFYLDLLETMTGYSIAARRSSDFTNGVKF